ncbi:MAG: UPF0149 family protein [Xanthomonadaceae bacterium]|nr:UPF0149 family protein [Xanthomonadaceae bacterium]
MSTPLIDDQPMSEAEVERLEDLLESQSADRPAMNVEMLDGFFTALVLGPERVPLGEYLPHIFGGDPVWSSDDQLREALALLIRLWNHIVWRLNLDLERTESGGVPGLLSALPFLGWPDLEDADADEDEQPFGTEESEDDVTVADIFARVPEGFPLAALWSLGFLEGMSLREAQWDAWVGSDETVAEAVVQILSLGQMESDESQASFAEVFDPLDRSERLALIEALPFLLQTVNDLRMAEFSPEPMPRQTPVVRPATPGRNEPCPCGSGKKFKKCCGAPGALH